MFNKSGSLVAEWKEIGVQVSTQVDTVLRKDIKRYHFADELGPDVKALIK